MAVKSSARRAAAADQERMAATLAAAFADDPVFSWLLPPGVASRERRLLTLFAALVRSYVPKDSCYLAAEGDAVALWAPPGRWATPMGDILGQLAPFLGALRFRAIHSLRCLMTVEKHHPKDPPHWYLGFLGTVPDRQGQGFGSQLLREVLQAADRDGVPAYLESSNRRNIPLYQRHGFEVVEELSMPGDCPPVWRMWRSPGAAEAPG